MSLSNLQKVIRRDTHMAYKADNHVQKGALADDDEPDEQDSPGEGEEEPDDPPPDDETVFGRNPRKFKNGPTDEPKKDDLPKKVFRQACDLKSVIANSTHPRVNPPYTSKRIIKLPADLERFSDAQPYSYDNYVVMLRILFFKEKQYMNPFDKKYWPPYTIDLIDHLHSAHAIMGNREHRQLSEAEKEAIHRIRRPYLLALKALPPPGDATKIYAARHKANQKKSESAPTDRYEARDRLTTLLTPFGYSPQELRRSTKN